MAAQIVKSIKQAAVRQATQTFETAKAQVGLPQSENLPKQETQQTSPQIVEEIQQNPQIDREAIARQEQTMLSQLESKLAQMRQVRKQEVQTYNQAQESKMQSVAPKEKEDNFFQKIAKKVRGGGPPNKKAESNQKNKG